MKRTKSSPKGVNYDKRSGKWIAKIAIDGIVYRLGAFKSESEAIDVRKKAETLSHEGFAKYYKELKQEQHMREAKRRQEPKLDLVNKRFEMLKAIKPTGEKKIRPCSVAL